MVEYVSLNGRKYPVTFSQSALLYFADAIGVGAGDLADAIVNITDYQALQLLYAGFKFGSEKKGRRFVISFSDFTDLMNAEPEAIEDAVKVFEKSMKLQEEVGKKVKGEKKEEGA